MPRITLELLRKRSEHNDGMLSTLEEISLHQEELERIEVIGTRCRKLRILYLQNNIIETIEDLTHMKELRYLNLALNNISTIDGLAACEFLNKLDLTVNFIDFDTLEASIDHLKPLQHLRELYMLGNPSQSDWPDNGFREYVIASLPQLELLDGKPIYKSDRIQALQVLSQRQQFLRTQAALVRADKAANAAATAAATQSTTEPIDCRVTESDVIDVSRDVATDISLVDTDTNNSASSSCNDDNTHSQSAVFDSDAKVPYTPETRRTMYMELAEQKAVDDARKRENEPRARDAAAEHAATLQRARHHEMHHGDCVRQCNDAKWPFRLRDELLEVVLEVDLPRFLDTSLVDVDVHPTFVSIVAKNKILRLRFPERVHSDAGTAERSKVTGTLRLTLPKANVTATQKLRAQLHRDEAAQAQDAARTAGSAKGPAATRTRSLRNGGVSRVSKLSDEVLAAASAASMDNNNCSRAVQIRGLVAATASNQDVDAQLCVQLTPIATKAAAARTSVSDKRCNAVNPAVETDSCTIDDDDDDDDAPPLLY